MCLPLALLTPVGKFCLLDFLNSLAFFLFLEWSHVLELWALSSESMNIKCKEKCRKKRNQPRSNEWPNSLTTWLQTLHELDFTSAEALNCHCKTEALRVSAGPFKNWPIWTQSSITTKLKWLDVWRLISNDLPTADWGLTLTGNSLVFLALH